MTETPGSTGSSPYPSPGSSPYPPPGSSPYRPPSPAQGPGPGPGGAPGRLPPPPPGASGYPAPGPSGPPAYPQPAPGYSGYPGQGGPGGAPYEFVPNPGWNGFAIAAFIVGLLVPLLGPLIAIPLGIVALVHIGKTRERGKALAIAGMVLSVLWWLAFIAFGAVLALQDAERNANGAIVEAGRIGYDDIREGDCVNIPDPAGSGDVDLLDLQGVPCSEEHNAQTVALLPLDGDEFPGDQSIDDQSRQPCLEAVSALPAVRTGNTKYRPYRLAPTESLWDEDGGREALCFVTRADYADMTDDLVR